MERMAYRRPRKDWPWYKVKAALEALELSLADIARRHDYTASAAHKVKRVPIPNMQAHIAEALGIAPQTIWPSRYDRQGRPVRLSRWLLLQKNSTARHRRNVHSDKAA